MADDASPLPWTGQQWADLRAAALDSARSARVASTFLPLVGPLAPDQTTVPSNWMKTASLSTRQLGEAETRLETRSGKTLYLVTISCNVYLRGAEVADPELSAAKAMVRRAAEVLGRLEDAIIFHGLPPKADGDETRIPKCSNGTPVVRPLIYRVTGGRDLTGLLQAPDTYLASSAEPGSQLEDLKKKLGELADRQGELEKARKQQANVPQAETAERAAWRAVKDAEKQCSQDIMSVRVKSGSSNKSAIVEAIVDAIQKLEGKGHFGPFAVVLGHRLFSRATTPTGSLVLPTDRLAEFLDGRRVMRSGTLPPDDGIVVALGGQPIELVLARDVDISFLQVNIEPRFVLRVFERFVLRIKELDAVCRVTTNETRLTPGFTPRRADS